jgi:hypothetical protein
VNNGPRRRDCAKRPKTSVCVGIASPRPGAIGTAADVALGCSRDATPFGDRLLSAHSTFNRLGPPLSMSCGHILKLAIDLKILATGAFATGRFDRSFACNRADPAPIGASRRRSQRQPRAGATDFRIDSMTCAL